MKLTKHFRNSVTKLLAVTTLCSAVLLTPSTAMAETKSKFRLAWTIYVGWMPWDYGNASGIVKKWADKYDIDIEIVQVNDYVESINQYTSGGFDATVMMITIVILVIMVQMIQSLGDYFVKRVDHR